MEVANLTSAGIHGGACSLPFVDDAESFLAGIAAISSLSDVPAEEGFNASEIERFSSMVTFLKDWRHFCYELKFVDLSWETMSGQRWEVVKGMTLPQFSSASVPKVEPLRDKRSNDFLLHAGGPVWALDWCPRAHQTGQKVNCEFLAVAAHPPGATYHKIGAPLTGRGVIQIWCLLVEQNDLNAQVISTASRPIGRPRKRKINDEVLTADALEMTRSAKKGRGRPRKIARPDIAENVVSSKILREKSGKEDLEKNQNATTSGSHHVQELSEGKTNERADAMNEEILAYGVSLTCDVVTPPAMLRRRGRPRKNPNMIIVGSHCAKELSFLKAEERKNATVAIANETRALCHPMTLESMQSSTVNDGSELLLPKKRGRAKKISVTNVDEKVSLPDEKSGEDQISYDRIDSSLNDTSQKTGSLMHVSIVSDSFKPKRRGRPRKNVNLGVKKKSQASVNELILHEAMSFARCQKENILELQSDVATSDVSTIDFVPYINFNGASVVSNDIITAPIPITASENSSSKSTLFDAFGRQVTVDEKLVSDKKMPFVRSNCQSSHLSKANARPELSTAVLPIGNKDCQDLERYNGLVDVLTDVPLMSDDTALPKVVFLLAHDGKVAWDAKWRPHGSHSSEGRDRLGYLAVLLGNGSLEVWEVPAPFVVWNLYSSCKIEGVDPRFLKLNPVFKCSKLSYGGRQSIPLTIEWSPTDPNDLILAGCHDGTVALWKFSTDGCIKDARPLLCFTADTVPLRALAWAPESDGENANLFLTAGHDGIKFWDLRDPYRPLWEFNPVQRAVLSVNWQKDLRCIIFALDDGTVRTLSLCNLPYDLPVVGKPFNGTKQPGMHSYYCSDFAIWSVHTTTTTGVVAYCGADGSIYRFQLTEKSLKDSRNRGTHHLCGSFSKDGETLEIKSPLFHAPSTAKASASEPRTKILVPCGNAQEIQAGRAPNKAGSSRLAFVPEVRKIRSRTKEVPQETPSPDQTRQSYRRKLHMPDKQVAVHRVRWNTNKGSEKWLCYGGAAGIVRCQEIT